MRRAIFQPVGDPTHGRAGQYVNLEGEKWDKGQLRGWDVTFLADGHQEFVNHMDIQFPKCEA